ncbi:MAG: phenylacetate--CoA ligase family protein [Deltaproteobacteria bacterium]|nr:MAG: phenylacetate--CoA ligase family protein [Deltaproteobacteria bacterium]RLA98263.1 MAG: phenylacetate--CoA ligase family protein [Deltaproteobacteria bacterium]
MERKTFFPDIKSEEELKEIQLRGLQWTVKHAYEGSEFYRKKLDEAGVKPEDIKTLEDIRRLPFTTADDLRAGYPFPLRAVPFERIVRIHASSGTTGKRKVLCYTQKDIDDWADMFARCYEMAGLSPEDRVQIAVGYGVWTAGVGFQLGCERFGAMAIPVGPGNLDMQCQFLEDFQSTVLCCTASMALLMAEEVERRGLRGKINLKKVILGSERSSDAMRRKIKELLGVEEIFDIPGLTELYGPGTGLDCPKHEGIHYWADYYILELLDPQTLEPVPPGEVGEMVVTTLKKEAAPLIRYRTRDLTRLIPHRCSCGSIFPMHDRILGRSDDMFIFRAVNIYPSQIDEILSGIPEVGSEYQIILERGKDGRDYMTVKVERERGGDPSRDKEVASRIEGEIKNKILVSCKVQVVDYGSLPRSERKSKRVFDYRE